MTWLWIAIGTAYWIAIGVFGADIKERYPAWSYVNVTALAIVWPYWVVVRLIALWKAPHRSQW